HAHTGLPRDDDFGLRSDAESGWNVIAVADGAGSAEFARKGSQIACQTAESDCLAFLTPGREEAFAALAAEPWREDLADAAAAAAYDVLAGTAFKAKKAIEAEAARKGKAARSYATTFLIAMAKRYGGRWLIASFWVGDGAMAVYAEGKPVQLLGAPDAGEYSGQTRFLTENAIFAGGKAAERVRVGVYEDFTALVLMTDGVSDPVFETEAGLEDTQRWDAMWQGLRGKAGLERPEQGVTEQALADWAGFYSAQDHDDRTIAIFY
ncbi:MAG: protein phosphatase 2C domain-containing protein, partial [Duodenibacillus sp.]|nr:protein phosphatase 2C domain-containing protein [Duodenibacillus sp.]